MDRVKRKSIWRFASITAILAATACNQASSPALATPAPTPTPSPTPPPSTARTVHPGPETFRIGNAVAPIYYASTAWTLNDLYKQSGYEAEIGDTSPGFGWTPVNGGQWRAEDRPLLQLDALGWPTTLRLSNGAFADELWTHIISTPDNLQVWPSGEYQISWEGAGTLSVNGPTIISSSANSMTVSFTGTGDFILVLRETDPAGTGDYVRNISVLRPDAVDGERFMQTYLDFVNPFSVIRPLHMVGEQLTYGPAVPWGERKPENYSHWGGGLGAPYEVIIDLANQSDSDLWLNLPVAADDDHFRDLADLTLANLDDERKLYIEIGNELWNFSDPYVIGRAQAIAIAETRWPGILNQYRPWLPDVDDVVDENMFVASWLGTRTAEACDIFKAQWGAQSERVICVIAGQVGASGPSYFPNRFLLETPVAVGEEGRPPAGERLDAFATGPYMQEPEALPFNSFSAETFFQDATDMVLGEGAYGPNSIEPGMRYQIREDAALAAEFGIPLVAYEGGQHFIGSSFTRDVIANHPLMYDLFKDLFDVWREEGGRPLRSFCRHPAPRIQ